MRRKTGGEEDSRIVMTGGHAGSTALAVVEQVRLEGKPWKIYWIGAKHAFEGSKEETFEAKVFPGMRVGVYYITTGRLQRKWSIHTIPSLLKIPIGVWQSIRLLRRIKPKVVLSFGGFASLPVVIAAYLLRVRIVLHEQTTVVGLANRMAAWFATEIAIARGTSGKYLPKSKTVLVGNPLRQAILKLATKDATSSTPIVFVTGGSRGAMRINDAVEKDILKLLSKYHVVQLTGQKEYDKFVALKKKLLGSLKRRYEVYSFLETREFAKKISNADVVVSRAGANTISELIFLRKKMVLVPIPWSRYDEQNKNAKLARQNGVAVILHEDKLVPGALFENIGKVMKMRRKDRSDIAELDLSASGHMVKILEKYA